MISRLSVSKYLQKPKAKQTSRIHVLVRTIYQDCAGAVDILIDSQVDVNHGSGSRADQPLHAALLVGAIKL